MAEYIAGSETDFVKMMNEKARKLGMKHSNFKNCNGLDDSIKSGHFSSAYDVALMSRELITKHPQISKYSTAWMDTITQERAKKNSDLPIQINLLGHTTVSQVLKQVRHQKPNIV